MSLSLYRTESDPFMPLERRMNMLFRSFLDDLNNTGGQGQGGQGGQGGMIMPRADFWEDKEAYHAHLDLPGVKKQDIHLEVTDNKLRVWGEMKSKFEKKDKSVLLQERRTGRFERVFHLEHPVDKDRVRAKCEDGVLDIHIPKKDMKDVIKNVDVQ